MVIKKNLNELEILIKEFLSKKIDVNYFIKNFEVYYANLFLKDEKKTVHMLGGYLSSLFDDIHAEVNFFVSDKESRKEHKNYLNEDGLRKSVRKIYLKIINQDLNKDRGGVDND